MRIIVIDSDISFTSGFEQRCKKASVFCQVFSHPVHALAELKKDPDKVDLLLVCRELAGNQEGLSIVQSLRKDPRTMDIPYILMSSAWTKNDFAKHQKTEFGANAYFNKKNGIQELDSLIEAVTGNKFTANTQNTSNGTLGSGILN